MRSWAIEKDKYSTLSTSAGSFEVVLAVSIVAGTTTLTGSTLIGPEAGGVAGTTGTTGSALVGVAGTLLRMESPIGTGASTSLLFFFFTAVSLVSLAVLSCPSGASPAVKTTSEFDQAIINKHTSCFHQDDTSRRVYARLAFVIAAPSSTWGMEQWSLETCEERIGGQKTSSGWSTRGRDLVCTMPRPVKASKKRVRKETMVNCRHCGVRVTQRTERRHLKALKRPKIPLPIFNTSTSGAETDNEDMDVDNLDPPDAPGPELDAPALTEVDAANIFEAFAGVETFDVDFEMEAPPSRHPSPDPVPLRRSKRIWVEDVPEDEDEDEDAETRNEEDGILDEEHGVDWNAEIDEEGLEALTLEDLIWGDVEAELSEFAQELTDDEVALLRHYALKVETYMTLSVFEALPFAFRSENIQSWKVTKSRAAFLARFKPVPYDCCINSCCCFVGPHAEDSRCEYCNEPRFRPSSKRPRKRFCYIPLIPRLVSFFRSPSMMKEMKYRANYSPDPDKN
ncbi:hypothetical protein D9758_017947 [Tetrapyrgos nigripes]|uniref:Uncharacterized protein n=1 Tax=Tetrapyrgos nigripes TaxID=182062 RepID=A0A8H5FA43_9AGAR|nr:hypothetical protein D9758_017947 [Tetrapyrgos nigripes]